MESGSTVVVSVTCVCSLAARTNCERVENVPGPQQQTPGSARKGRLGWCVCTQVCSHWRGLGGVMCGTGCLYAPSGTGASSQVRRGTRPAAAVRCWSAPAPARSLRAAGHAAGGERETRRSWRDWPRPRIPASSPGLGPTCSVGGACPGACPDGSGGARERAGGASFQGFLGLPRWPPPRSRPGARRPRVRVGVRRGRLCGSAGASAPVRRRVPGVRPARPAVPPPPLARRGPAGPRQARPEPPGGECGRTQPAGWWGRGRSRAAGLRGSSAVGCLGASSCKEAAGSCQAI